MSNSESLSIQALRKFEEAMSYDNKTPVEINRTLREYVKWLKEELEKALRIIELQEKVIEKDQEIKRLKDVIIRDQQTIIDDLKGDSVAKPLLH